MNDDFQLSSETAALAALAGRVVNASFDKAMAGDLDGFDVEVDAAMASARPAFQDEDAARQEEILVLTKRAMRLNFGAMQAMRDGRKEDAALSEAECKTIQALIQQLNSYRGFTAAAERLHLAKGFDDFLKTLPDVDLGRLYGSGRGAIAPFPLIWAMQARDKALERVQAMLNAGARLDLVTKFPNFTVLHWVAQSKRKGLDKRLAMLRLLVLKGADLEARDRYGRTPLHVAIMLGSVNEVAILLKAGADVHATGLERDLQSQGRAGLTPLMLAASEPEKIRLLLDHGADPQQRGGDGWDLLAHLKAGLAVAGQWLMAEPEKKRAGSTLEKLRDSRAAGLALLEPLLAPRTTDPLRKLTYREAPEQFQALQADLPLDEYRKTLVTLDVNTFQASNDDRPIYWPIRAKTARPQRLWLMLQAGASVKVYGTLPCSPLHVLAAQKHKDVEEQRQMVRLLLQSGASLEAQDHSGLTPLAVAVARGGPAEVAALLAEGASVHATAATGFSKPRQVPLLMMAATSPTIFGLLLQNGADPAGRSDDGMTVAEFLAAEITRYDADLQEDMSGNLRRNWTRFRRGVAASEALLSSSVERSAMA